MPDPQIQSKSSSINAIMKNPKLSKIVNEAVSSPIGSTKRQKARSILRSLNMVNQNYMADGRGGYNNNEDESFSSIYANLPITQQISSSETAERREEQPESEVEPSFEVFPEGKKGPTTIVPSAPKKKTPEEKAEPKTFTQAEILDPAIQELTNKVESGEITIENISEENRTKVEQALKGRERGRSIAKKAGAIGFPDGDLFTPAPKKEEKAPEVSAKILEQLQKYSVEDYNTWFQGLSKEEKERWRPLYEAVKAGVGPETFAYQMRADKEKLKKLLPGVPEEALPEGASLAGQVNEIADRLKEEHKIDTLADRVRNLEERDLTVEKDLDNYITSKDKYISKIDNMINKAKDASLEMDMANPYINERMNNYLDYLHVLRGRQENRYSDFLNDSIDYHEAELERATGAYKTAYDNFTTELKTQEEITTEDYENLNTMLEEMYNNLAGREEEQMDLVTRRLEYMESSKDMIETALDGKRDFEEVGPTDVEETRNILEENREKGKTIIPLDIWLEQKRKWDIKYGSGEFEENFPPEEWLNPNDPKARKYFLTPLQLIKDTGGGNVPSNEELAEEV